MLTVGKDLTTSLSQHTAAIKNTKIFSGTYNHTTLSNLHTNILLAYDREELEIERWPQTLNKWDERFRMYPSWKSNLPHCLLTSTAETSTRRPDTQITQQS